MRINQVQANLTVRMVTTVRFHKSRNLSKLCLGSDDGAASGKPSTGKPSGKPDDKPDGGDGMASHLKKTEYYFRLGKTRRC